MQPTRLEHLLEKPAEAPFYDLLGGLADNLLTVGGHAGTFVACAACGDTFTLKGESWRCECCGEGFELKFAPAKSVGTPFETTVKVSGLSKPRWNPHWYYENENWSVAEFMTQMLRLRPEDLLGPWFQRLGVEVEAGTALETVLCWPRFAFGGKTIQPDLVVAFEQDIVLVEFKRPGRGVVPPVEVMGQLCFAIGAARQLSRRWHLVLVPGSDAATTRTPVEYVREALTAVPEAATKWALPPDDLDAVRSAAAEELATRVRVFGWESLLRLSSEAIVASVPDCWSRQQALVKLRYFQSSRAERKLLAPPVDETR